jgi:hypothetical protein
VSVIDNAILSSALLFIVVGLVFEASGFGTFVAGHLGGLLLVVIGIPMFWAGWNISGAREFSCATASALNMFDAASTIAFWNFELNPVVKAAGPTLFLIAKVVCSIVIVLYAKFHSNPRKGGLILSAFFSLIVGWNLGQNAIVYLGLLDINSGLLLGVAMSFTAAALVVLMLFSDKRISLKA